MTARSRTSRTPRRRTVTATQRSRTPWIIAGGVAVVLLAGVAAFALAQPNASAPSEPARQPVAVQGTALPLLPSSGGDPAVGQQIPKVTGVDLSGKPITIGPGGQPQVIVILAHWCPHCQAEVPRIVQWLQSGGLPQGVRMVTLATSIDPARPNYPPSAWLKRESWTPPVMVDDANSRALSALGMEAFPGFVLVNSQGKVVLRETGEQDINTLAQQVQQLATQ